MIAEKISRIGEPSSPAIAAGYRPRPENYRPQRESRSHLYPAPGSRCRAARSSCQERAQVTFSYKPIRRSSGGGYGQRWAVMKAYTSLL